MCKNFLWHKSVYLGIFLALGFQGARGAIWDTAQTLAFFKENKIFMPTIFSGSCAALYGLHRWELSRPLVAPLLGNDWKRGFFAATVSTLACVSIKYFFQKKYGRGHVHVASGGTQNQFDVNINWSYMMENDKENLISFFAENHLLSDSENYISNDRDSASDTDTVNRIPGVATDKKNKPSIKEETDKEDENGWMFSFDVLGDLQKRQLVPGVTNFFEAQGITDPEKKFEYANLVVEVANKDRGKGYVAILQEVIKGINEGKNSSEGSSRSGNPSNNELRKKLWPMSTSSEPENVFIGLLESRCFDSPRGSCLADLLQEKGKDDFVHVPVGLVRDVEKLIDFLDKRSGDFGKLLVVIELKKISNQQEFVKVIRALKFLDAKLLENKVIVWLDFPQNYWKDAQARIPVLKNIHSRE